MKKSRSTLLSLCQVSILFNARILAPSYINTYLSKTVQLCLYLNSFFLVYVCSDSLMMALCLAFDSVVVTSSVQRSIIQVVVMNERLILTTHNGTHNHYNYLKCYTHSKSHKLLIVYTLSINIYFIILQFFITAVNLYLYVSQQTLCKCVVVTSIFLD